MESLRKNGNRNGIEIDKGMKAVFTKSIPNRGQVVSGVEIDVRKIEMFCPMHIGCMISTTEGFYHVAESRREIVHIITATMGKSKQPHASSDHNQQEATV